MTVTIKDVLRFPSMRGAVLLTDSAGLAKPVTAVSVLEYSDPTPMQKDLSNKIKYLGDELVLTAFASVANDVAAQCANIRQMAHYGDTGMILFYVGLLMPKVDPQLIETANAVGYVLIMMPSKDKSLAYSSVISDIMQEVFLDRIDNPVFAIDMLKQVTKLPDTLHSVDTVLRMLSDRLHCSIALLDRDYQLLQSAAWPAERQEDWDRFAAAEQQHQPITDDRIIDWETVSDTKQWGMIRLLLLIDGRRMNVYTRSQIIEAIQIALDLWGHEAGPVNKVSLLAAVMEDEPIRMRHLGEYYHLDLSQIHHMWLIPNFQGLERHAHQTKLAELSEKYAPIAICERYNGMLYIVPSGDLDPITWEKWGNALAAQCHDWQAAVPVRCQDVTTPALVREAVQLTQEAASDAAVIFYRQPVLTLGNLRLAKTAREKLSAGEQNINAYLNRWLSLFNQREQTELLQTLTTYLLDTHQNAAATAAFLYVHPNTVKYRLNKLAGRFGFPVGQMPDSWALYELCGVLRLAYYAKQ